MKQILIITFLLLFTFLNATIINVPADQPTIQDGINAAASTDTVLVQPGTYSESIDFNGKLITVGSLFLTTNSTSYISSTIIEGPGILGHSTLAFWNNETSSSILCGFTITAGSPGILCYYTSPTLINLIVSGNNTHQSGGGICLDHSNPIIENVTISDNSSTYSGGGILCFGSSPSLENVIITGNTSPENGGGVSIDWDSDPSLVNVTISGNNASINGGGIYCGNYSEPTFDNVTISNNTATSVGGGIFCNEDSSPSFENVTITENNAVIGGGILSDHSSPIFLNSIVWNNTPEDVYSILSTTTITYSDIGGGWPDTGNINSDPLFSGDYYLNIDSPCIDTGDPASTLDPDGTRADMGTHYYHQVFDAEFIPSYQTNGDAPLTINFTDLSTLGIGEIDEWYWDFGDGNYSALQNPTHEYVSIGFYTVSLTVTNVLDSTDTETKVDLIGVTAPAHSGPTWHISTAGSDIIGNGSEQYPFATITKGKDSAVDGDIVLVQPGTYTENLGFGGKQITIGSLFLTTQNSSYISSTIIDGGNYWSVVGFSNSEDSTSVLCGFTITNGAGAFELYGGGIYCDNASPTLKDLVISGNSANMNGGGIYCKWNSSPIIKNVTISDNSADYGGGIYCDSSDPNLENVTITNNSATYNGGGIQCIVNSNPILQNVTISDNTVTTYHGGGIYCDNSSPILENVTITNNNTAYAGGGILCYNNSSPTLENVTISENTASVNGGGIYIDGSNPILLNSILWNDSPEEIVIGSGTIAVTYSDIEGVWAGTGNIVSDPLFVDPGSGDYRLQSISPCIDAGNPISPLDPDGTITDMGGNYLHQFIDVNFTANIVEGDAALTVNFTDLSIPGSGAIDEWLWDFGDGNSSTSQNPSNEYLLPGLYTVSLSVNDVNDSTGTQTKWGYIQVNIPTSGTVWHVSTTGSDVVGDGSIQFPFATIQHGIDTSSNIDIVFVQPGTYFENIILNGKLITIASLFFTTQNPDYISSTIVDGSNSGTVLNIYNVVDSTAVISGFTITNGSDSGIICSDSSPKLENVVISVNTTMNGNGGGIRCEFNSSPTLENVVISNNTTMYGNGGGIYCDFNSNLNLENVVISGNTSMHDEGGGIYCSGSSPSLENVLISGNSAMSGGGLYCGMSSNPVLENVTITDNSAGDGGGIYCIFGFPVLINSILWNNNTYPEIYIEMGSVTVTYSDIEGGWTGTGNIDSDPEFVNPYNEDYHLTEYSPCIDTGDPASALDPDGTRADMGAYHFDQSVNPPQNVSVEIIGANVHLSWDAVTNADYYIIYSSNDPNGTFSLEAYVGGTTWSEIIGDIKKFYYVKAVR